MKERILSISEAAKQLKVETHVLRYWEEELDISIPRNDMGHRLYGAKEMKLLHSVKELKSQGFQLRAIKLLLHDIKDGEDLDLNKLIAMREEINRRVEFLNDEEFELEGNVPEVMRDTLIQKQIKSPSVSRENVSGSLSQERVNQFQYIMLHIMNNALQENNHAMTAQIQEMIHNTLYEELPKKIACSLEQALGEQISDEVSTRIIKEMNYVSRVREEKEEERYQHLDEMLRNYQEGAKECASARQRKKMKKKEERLMAVANGEEKKATKKRWHFS